MNGRPVVFPTPSPLAGEFARLAKTILGRKIMSYRALVAALVFGLAASLAPAVAVELDPKAVIYTLPKDLKWKDNGGNENVVLFGDPSKAGL